MSSEADAIEQADVAIKEALCADCTIDTDLLAYKRALRDLYRAGRRDQYLEDEPLFKKRPTAEEVAESHRRRFKGGW
jgi:hypothetical protein